MKNNENELGEPNLERGSINKIGWRDKNRTPLKSENYYIPGSRNNRLEWAAATDYYTKEDTGTKEV